MKNENLNLGGYTESDFYESDGNASLSLYLQKKQTIKTHFNEADKFPNFDGCFDLLCNNTGNITPKARINVQIKTMNKSYANSNKKIKTNYPYKYTCETKIFNAVKKGISLDPAVLFLVDIKSKKFYWLYVSQEYVFDLDLKNEKTKTIFFSDENLIGNIDSFYKKVNKICEEIREHITNLSENQVLTNVAIDEKNMAILQEQSDYINGLMDGCLNFIKKQYFSDIWKFGISYSKNDTSSAIGIYRIRKGENDCLIRDFSEWTSEISFSQYRNDYRSIPDQIKELIFGLVHSFFKDGFINPSVLPDIILEEIAFDFLDRIARRFKEYEKQNFPCVYLNDSESVDVIEKYLKALIETSFHYLDSHRKSEKDNKYFYEFDPLEFFDSSKQYNTIFLSTIRSNEHTIKQYPFNVVLCGNYSYRLLNLCVKELKRRSISRVNRVWKHKDYLNFSEDLKDVTGFSRSETGYRVKDFYYNITKMIALIPGIYAKVAPELFGSDVFSIIQIKKKYTLSFSNCNNRFEYAMLSYPDQNFEINISASDFEKIKNMDFKELEVLYPDTKSISTGSFSSGFVSNTMLYDCLKELLYSSLCRYLGTKPVGRSFFH